MAAHSNTRIRALSALIIAFGCITLWRLFSLQVLNAARYEEEANRQYARPSENWSRGSIFFTKADGTPLAAATLTRGSILAINPTHIESAAKAYTQLSRVYRVPRALFMERAAKAKDPYEELARHLSATTSAAIEALEIPGVSLYPERWRVYPSGTLAAHSIGFLGYLSNEYAGRYGLERAYDALLRREGSNTSVNFFAELFSDLGERARGEGEGDLYLTIEPTAQQKLEEVLHTVQERWSASSVGGIVMEPKTGALRAFAALPSYDPGTPKEDIAVLANPLVERVYEMGSIMKPMTIAAALDAGVITPEMTYNDRGFVELNTARIENYDGKARGVVPMQEVLNQSLNTGAVFAMQKLGRERMRRYFLDFGFGEKTGIELPDEVAGLVKNLESNRDIEFATASFGQGIALSPLSMTRALAALGNGGLLMRPSIVQKIVYSDGREQVTEPKVQRRVLSQKTSETISRMLTTTFDEALVGGKFKLERYRIAAKTGTAQISEGGSYAEDRYMHTFFGYFPAFDPQFIVFLYMREPKGVRYASETLSEPFAQIASFLIHYYHIPPDR